MNERTFRLNIPHTVSYIRRRCRKVEREYLFDPFTVAIRCIDAKDAPVAFRIASADDAPILVREYDGKYWWPLVRPPDGTVDADLFRSLVEREDSGAIKAIDPLVWRSALLRSVPRRDFLSRTDIRKIEKTDFEARKLGAQRGASRLMIFDDIVHAEAGEPMWFVVRGQRDFELHVGSSQFDRPSGLGCEIQGLAVGPRLSAAKEGLAFDLVEAAEELDLLAKKSIMIVSRSRLEKVTANNPRSIAPFLCSEILAEDLRSSVKRMSNFSRALFARRLPILYAAAFKPAADRAAGLSILEELATTDDEDIASWYGDRIMAIAKDIVRRSRYRLTDEDDDAIGSLA